MEKGKELNGFHAHDKIIAFQIGAFQYVHNIAGPRPLQLAQGHGLNIRHMTIEFGSPEFGILVMQGNRLVDVEWKGAVALEMERRIANQMAFQITGEAIKLSHTHPRSQESDKLIRPFVLQGIHGSPDGGNSLARIEDISPCNIVILIERSIKASVKEDETCIRSDPANI